jgi:hypothetical protein
MSVLWLGYLVLLPLHREMALELFTRKTISRAEIQYCMADVARSLFSKECCMALDVFQAP